MRTNNVTSIWLILSLLGVGSVFANTIAYWRFEEGPAESVVEPPREDVVFDASGNGNHLQTWSASTAPLFVADTPLKSVPQSGASNTFALSFANGNRDLYTQEKPINSQVFDEITIEVSFKMNEGGRFQVIVGKDGNPVGGAPPLSLKVLPDGMLEFRMVDGIGEVCYVQSKKPLEQDEWYNAAVTATADEITLWLMRPTDSEYDLQGKHPIGGLFVVEASHWTVGRGMWNGGNADFFNGTVDEIRISDVVLRRGYFLGVPPPGHGTLLEF